MSATTPRDEARHAQLVAALLRHGTHAACALIGLGLAAELLPGGGRVHKLALDLMKMGIALFVLLPVARVALLSGLFLRERDILHAAISMLVLAIIAASFLLSLLASGGATLG